MTTTQEELVAHAGPTTQEVPADLKERAAETAEIYKAKVRRGLNRRHEQRAAAAGQGAQLGEPTVGPYVAFDLLALTPIQFGPIPPYQPSRIIAGGEWAVIFAFLFVNPTIDVANGFAVPPTVQLGGREYRVGMEQINLTDVADGPDDFRQAVFSAPAPDVTVLDFWFQAPNPGVKPRLMEANLSADIVDQAQPYAAFASTIVDADTFEVLPNVPVRYLVYTQ